MQRLQKSLASLNTVEAIVKALTEIKVSRQNPQQRLKGLRYDLSQLGVSQRHLAQLNVIHIAGTKGKGSTAAFCETILRAHGLKTGLFTSPHLKRVNERIKVGNCDIADHDFVDVFHRVWRVSQTSFFPCLSLMAWMYFLQHRVNCAIIETGIGGQYDSTNVVDEPCVTGITHLGFDHQALLGQSIEEIAWQKGGIFKQGVPAWTVSDQNGNGLGVLKSRARDVGQELQIAQKIEGVVGIAGDMQGYNAGLALKLTRQVVEKVGVAFDEKKAQEALAKTLWPGRCQIVKQGGKKFFLDGAHTLESLQSCLRWWRGMSEKPCAVLFYSHEERQEALLSLLAKETFAEVIFTKADSATNDMHFEWTGPGRVHYTQSIDEALNLLSRMPLDVLVTGSLHLVGDVLSRLDG